MARRKRRTDTRRKEKTRDVRPRVLVVCEGEKTEPYYFQDRARHYQLSGVKAVGTGSDPKTLVERAKAERNAEARLGEPYDQVYCVFDRDEHDQFDDASH